MQTERTDELDGGRVFYGCLLVLWLFTAAPLWLVRIVLIGGLIQALQFTVSQALDGSLVEIYLLLSLLVPLAIPFWVAHEVRHRRPSQNGKDLPATFE